MTKQLLYVPPANIPEIMPYMTKYIKPALDQGINEKPWETFLGLALLGEIHIWLGFNDGEVIGAASTEFMDTHGYRGLHLITGSCDNGMGFEIYHKRIEEFARESGCKYIQFWGRKGWSRAADKFEGQNGEKYSEVYRVFAMEIDYDQTDNEPMDATPEFVGDRSEEGELVELD